MNNPFRLNYNYRVIEKVDGAGVSKFFPEQNWLIPGLWERLQGFSMDLDRDGSVQSLASANKLIIKSIKAARKKRTANRKVHPFNEVFHKLKND